MATPAPYQKFVLQVPPERLWWQDSDKGTKRLGESAHALGARQMVEGMPPEQTIYAEAVSRPEGKDPDDATHVHGFPKLFKALIVSMHAGWQKSWIMAGINRRGEIVIHDGWHRAAAALALGLEVVPVGIYFRDEDWHRFKHAVLQLNNGHKCYQLIPHPDFSYWPCWRKDTPRRGDVIAEYLGEHKTTVADVGCHGGALAFELAKRPNLRLHGYDTKPEALRVGELQKNMSDIGGDVCFWRCDEEGIPDVWGKVDATVCLSLLNHFYVKEQHDKARKFLAAIKAPLLIVDCPVEKDPVGGGTDFCRPEFVFSWLAEHGLPGEGHVIAPRSEDLQRPLLAYRPRL